MCKLYLASESPRRKELLARAGFDFSCCPHYFNESTHASYEAEKLVNFLANAKAHSAALQLHKLEQDAEKILLLSADTVVSIQGRVLEKPHDLNEARMMLKLLSDAEHQVYTAVSLLLLKRQHLEKRFDYVKLNEFSFCSCTDVSFYNLTDNEIERYLSTEEVLDKAGAYGIQGMASLFVKELHGSYENVVGLPLAACTRLIYAVCQQYALEIPSILRTPHNQ